MSKIIDTISTSEKDKIKKLIDEYKENNEFEISLFSNKKTSSELLTLERFNNLHSTLYKISSKNEEKYKPNKYISLDIIFTVEVPVMTNYRITITGIDKINEYMQMMYGKKSHLIFKTLLTFIKNEKKDNKYIKIIKKMKNTESYVTLEDFYMRIKLDQELELTKEEEKKLEKEVKRNSNILFRLKDRSSYFITKYKNIFQVDLTSVRQSHDINTIEESISKYEIEFECMIKDKKTIMDEIFNIAEFIIKIIQNSNFIISKNITEQVVDAYKNIFSSNKFYGRNVVSLGINNVVDELPNKYCVSDKADGERNELIVYNENCYLINSNFIVKNIGISVNKKYNGSILDGELLFIPKYNKYLFMVFDCLILGTNNIREEPRLISRLNKADELLNEIYNNHFDYDITGINVNNMQEVLKYHKDKLFKLYDNIDKELQKSKNSMIIRRKYFIEPFGISDTEVFNYSKLLWESFTINKDFKSLYELDGLIYQVANQKYILVGGLKDYKWKPPNRNSIDFYIEFEKNPATKKTLVVYNNISKDLQVDEESIMNKEYYICNLYVGNTKDDVETPVLFDSDKLISQCYIYLDDDKVPRSEDGKLINDKTVVEFYYDLTGNDISQYKWKPMKTRYDKTESVQKYKQKYGNYYTVAKNVWATIQNPILIDDFSELSDENTYQKQMNFLKSRITTRVVQEDAYYQKSKEKLSENFRKFQNWVKSLVMYEYLNLYYNNIQYNTLDYSIGTGGDVSKYYYASVKLMVGIDIDKGTLTNSINGPVSRYNRLKKTKRNVPQMFFIHATPSNILTYEEQIKNPKIGRMTEDNKKLFDRYFPNFIFDRLVCNFAIHYYLETEETWNNYCENIKRQVREGGYFTFVTFDGDILKEKLKGKNNLEWHYTYNGNKTLLYDIQKKYDDNDKSPFGQTINIYLSWIFLEGTYVPEYLVYPKFIINSLKEKCDFELVETGLFEDIYNNSKLFLENTIENDESEGLIKTAKDVYKFYEDSNDVNTGLKEIAFMNRYYVLKRKEHNLKEIKKKYYDTRISTIYTEKLI
jgi:hypothetical protein